MAKYLTTKQAVKAYYRYEDYNQARLEWESLFRKLMGVDDEIIQNYTEESKKKITPSFLYGN